MKALYSSGRPYTIALISNLLLDTLLRHFSPMQKPRDAMTAVFDDHGTSDDMDTELHLDYPVLPPQQSLDDHDFVPLITVQHQNLQRNKAIYAAIEHLQKQAAQLGCTLPHTTAAPTKEAYTCVAAVGCTTCNQFLYAVFERPSKVPVAPRTPLMGANHFRVRYNL